MLLVNYSIQKSYYTNVLCVNQDKPELKCNGKCHLSKQLAQDGNKGSEPKAPAAESFRESTLITLQEELTFAVFKTESSPNLIIDYSDELSNGYFNSKLDPPRLS